MSQSIQHNLLELCFDYVSFIPSHPKISSPPTLAQEPQERADKGLRRSSTPANFGLGKAKASQAPLNQFKLGRRYHNCFPAYEVPHIAPQPIFLFGSQLTPPRITTSSSQSFIMDIS